KTLYVGDSDVDAQTAENSGMDYVLVSWGFSSREDLEKWSPLEIADSPEDILKYFS
ncbi:MAG: HAD family hydrolase, partial [Lachnospiraceae bacterium]|nr:HAD family hydrolase [Lachnospiraceae bacterium]